MLDDVLNSTSTSSSSGLLASEWSASARNVSRSFVASLAFLLYDILLTVDEEVELLWKRNWSLFKFLYFYVRYVPLLLQIPLVLVGTEVTPRFRFTQEDCYGWQIYQGVIAILIMAPADYILVARIYALYHTTPSIQILVSIAYVVTIILMSVGLALSLPDIKYDGICHTTDVPRTLLINGGAEVAFQTLLFLLTLFKFIQSLRQEGWSIRSFWTKSRSAFSRSSSLSTSLSRGRGRGGRRPMGEERRRGSGGGGIPIMRMIVRDGTWGFFVLFSLVAAQALVYVADEEGGILFGWVLSSFSFCAYRILLNLNHIPRRSHRLHSRSHSRHRSSYTTTPYISFSNSASATNSRSRLETQTQPATMTRSQWTDYISPVSFDEWEDSERYLDGEGQEGGGYEYELAPMQSPAATPGLGPTSAPIPVPGLASSSTILPIPDDEQVGQSRTISKSRDDAGLETG
ncbi:hypothetical protein VKT23_007838 [Stygiomarasmius scandens]|uniref:DUF6533 domain-containing protein n=1 Tax=Marasmiellus scandens TaxID=2682957 RepID=A0ABR1JL23_9AGAR